MERAARGELCDAQVVRGLLAELAGRLRRRECSMIDGWRNGGQHGQQHGC
eukprot:gene5022-9321_t